MDGKATNVVPPQSILEVEQLVKKLYEPGAPEVISQINIELQKVQLSSEGWQVADTLLASADPNVRFFGALTFIVKLNTDGPTLDTSTAESVLSRLISWLVRLSHGQNALVGRKLCSTLTTYFLRSPLPWRNPIRQLALSLVNGSETSVADAEKQDIPLRDVLARLDASQLTQLLWFCQTLADDLRRTDATTAAHAEAHNIMGDVVSDASDVMDFALRLEPGTASTNTRNEALECFQSWVNYAQPVWPREPERLDYLRCLIAPTISCVADPELRVTVLDVLRDILESYTSFFKPEDIKLLARMIATHVRPALLPALQTNDPDGLPYGQMVIAYGSANVQHIVEDDDDTFGAETVLQLHLDILGAPGHPGDEDFLSTLSLEFWNTYTEYVTDTIFSQDPEVDPPAWVRRAKQVLPQVVQLLWKKMIVPPSETVKEWTADENEGFREFRMDSTDLMLSIYVFLSRAMLEQMASIVLEALQIKEWRALEAALFCLNALADNVLEEQPSEEILRTVFSSTLFQDVANFDLPIPLQTRRTAIDMLGAYGHYIEHHAEFLPDAVRFLFASLETTLCNTAAKSISTLCSTCRNSLTGELPGFLQQYQRFLEGPTSDAYTKEKVIGAIASIIQALTPESAKTQPLLALLVHVEKDIQLAKDLAANGNMEMAESVGVVALNCLASIGKGLQAPEDLPISLYEDDASENPQAGYWTTSEGHVVQQHIIGAFSVLSVLSHAGDAIEAACQVLRSGFLEVGPGPFVLPPSVTVDFLQQCSLRTPQLEAVLNTACTLITQHSRHGTSLIDNEAAAICEQVTDFIQELGDPAQDPGIASSCIDVVSRMWPRYVHLFFDANRALAPRLPAILIFTLRSIDGNDPFPKRSSQDFWARFLRFVKSGVAPEMQSELQKIVDAYGPQLCKTLMRQIGGLGQRSELDLLCEPLKVLIMTQAASKVWLEAALFGDAFPEVNSAVGPDEKRRFLQQIIGLRGDGRKTKDIVREFYAACRSTVVSY